MSYVNRRCRIFNEDSPYSPCYTADSNDPLNSEIRVPISYLLGTKRAVQDSDRANVNRRHSEGRMKTYNSAVNVSWSVINEERRQHILQLVRQEFASLPIGKFVPFEVIVEILIANSSKIIKQLQNEIDRLKAELERKEKIDTGDVGGQLQKEIDRLKEELARREEADFGNVNGQLQNEINHLKEELAKKETVTTVATAKDFITNDDEEKSTQACDEEKKELQIIIEDLKKQLEIAEDKLKELDLMKNEKDSLEQRIEDLLKIQKEHEDLLEKFEDFDKFQGSCVDWQTFKKLEDKYNELKSKTENITELEKGKDYLVEKIEECENIIANQANEIMRLSCHIKCLTQNRFKIGTQFHRQLPVVCEGGAEICPEVAEVGKFLSELDQNQTNEQIHALQNAVNTLTSELELEKEKNITLTRRYTNQCQLVSNMQTEIVEVKKKSHRERRKLRHLFVILKDILGGSSGSIRSCLCLGLVHPKPATLHTISNFHTKPSLQEIASEEFKLSWIVKRGGLSSSTDSNCSCESYSTPE